jgi:hypothetical protein
VPDHLWGVGTSAQSSSSRPGVHFQPRDTNSSHLASQINNHEPPFPDHLPSPPPPGRGGQGRGLLLSFKVGSWFISQDSMKPNTCAFYTAKTLVPKPQLVSLT